MTGRVLSLGSILVDLTVDVPALPSRGGDLLATGTRTLVGGGFNLASSVARQGVSCRYGGPHGAGPYGTLVRAALDREGIEAVLPARSDADTGFCITLVEPDGERSFVTMPGVDADLRADDLSSLNLRDDDLVAVSGYDLAYPQSGPVLAAWVAHLDPAEPPIVLDPGPLVTDIPADRLGAVLPRLAVLTMNQREARLLAGTAGDATGADLVAAVRNRPGVRGETVVVVREGAAGCVAAGGALGGEPHAVPAPTVDVLDTTGAGDTHTGVLLAALAGGATWPAALQRATVAAAIAVTRAGPATAPTAAELDRALP